MNILTVYIDFSSSPHEFYCHRVVDVNAASQIITSLVVTSSFDQLLSLLFILSPSTVQLRKVSKSLKILKETLTHDASSQFLP